MTVLARTKPAETSPLAARRLERAGGAVPVDRITLALLLGTHPDQISRYTAEGMPVRKGGGRGSAAEYDAVACCAWHRQRRPAGSVEIERQRHLKAQADLDEQTFRKRAGELVESVEVEAMVGRLVVATRERIRAVPVTARQRGLVTDEGEEALLDMLDDALRELARSRETA